MMSQPMKIAVITVSLAVASALAFPALAQTAKPTKQKKQEVVQPTKRANAVYRGQDKFRGGPLYNGPVYLGDDPDPYIRFEINRDLGAKYGGSD